MRLVEENLREKRFDKINGLSEEWQNFTRDYTAILYSHAFRRLRHKTQVFFFSHNDHVCTRLDHALYVANISEVVCINLEKRGIKCNHFLARAIGIGHDLGHTPFGHSGERVLNKLSKDIGGFSHEKHSLRVVDKIENPAKNPPIYGLNLTLAVRDGIINHCGEDKSTSIFPLDRPDLSGTKMPFTIEGCIVRLVDKIAYLGRDLEDALIAKFIKETDLPMELAVKVGDKNGEIVDYFVDDIINSSNGQNIRLSKEAGIMMNKLFILNIDKIYKHPKLGQYEERVNDVLDSLFNRFLNIIMKYEDDISKYMNSNINAITVLGKYIYDRKALYFVEERSMYESKELLYKRIVIDFMATLTDNFVFDACAEFFLPKPII